MRSKERWFQYNDATSNGSWRQGINGECPAQLMSQCYWILFIEYVFESQANICYIIKAKSHLIV